MTRRAVEPLDGTSGAQTPADGPRDLPARRPARSTAARLLRGTTKIPLYLVGRLSRRDPRLWVFGNDKGFRDSPRYLAEYIANDRPELTACWVARSAGEAAEARAAGLQVVLFGKREAVRTQRRAGVAFFCHSFADVELAHVAGAYLVHLHHGTALKRISLDVDRSRFTGDDRLRTLLSRTNTTLLALKHRNVDMYVAGGLLAKSRYETAFGASPERVRPLGTPRFDIIRGGPAYERVAGPNLRARLGYRPDDRVVLWLPTWREYGDAAWLPELDVSGLEGALADTDVMLLVKTHPFAARSVYQQRLPEHQRVKVLDEREVDVNCLLHVADELVTDYSSAMFDYAILERPIHLFAPDVDAYSAGRDLYEPYETLTGGLHHRDWPSLLQALRERCADTDDSEGRVIARLVARFTRNNVEPDVCRRIVETILGEINLPSSVE